MRISRRRITAFAITCAALAGATWAQADDAYPNLLVNREQIATVREKVLTEPYRTIWQTIQRDAEQIGRRHSNPALRGMRQWERALVYAVTGDRSKVEDLRHSLLSKSRQTVAAITAYDWTLATDAVHFDLLGSSFTAAEQAQCRKYFAAKARAAMVFCETYRGTHNMMSLQRWNTALLGYAARDPEVIEWAMTSDYGFEHSINSLNDNIWDESSPYAIHYVLPGWIAVAEAARNYDGTNLWAYRSPDGDSLQGWLDRYIDMCYPLEETGIGRGSVRIASYGDGATTFSTASTADDIYLMNAPFAQTRDTRETLAALLEVAYARFGDARYAWFLSLNPDRDHCHERSYLNYTGLTHGLDLPADVVPPPAPSGVWRKAAKAMLRADGSSDYWEGGSPAVFMLMNSWYGHDHRDRFEIMFHANGRLLYPDYNLMQYEPASIGWTRHGIGHNVVLVDRLGPWGGPQEVRELLVPEVKFIAVSGDPSAQVNEHMKKLEVRQTRALALTRDYLLDLFHLRSQVEREREYTWVLHGIGRLRSDDMAHFVRPEAPVLNHFRWIAEEKHWHTDSNWSVEWIQQTGGVLPGTDRRTSAWFDATPVGVRMTMLGAPGTEAHIGQGPLVFSAQHGINPNDAEGSMPMALARRRARTAIFTALHEPFVKTPQRIQMRRMAETKDTVAVEITGEAFRDLVMTDLGTQGGEREITMADSADAQQQFRFTGFAYLRASDQSLAARGELDGFRVHAPGVQQVSLNGRPLDIVPGPHGYIAFNMPAATKPPPAESGASEPARTDPEQPAVLAALGPVVAPLRLAPGMAGECRLVFTNLTATPALCAVRLEPAAGLEVDDAVLDLGEVAAKAEISFVVPVRVRPDVPAGQILQLTLTPETAGQAGQPLTIPVAVGVYMVDIDGKGGQFDLYKIVTPSYVATMSKILGVIDNVIDADGYRRGALNNFGINHWGFPASGNPWDKEKRIFGINGGTQAFGQRVKLLQRTATSLSFERTTPSAHHADGPAEKLHYRFFDDHIDMAIETVPGETVELNLSAFERFVARDTVLHWSDGDTSDFGLDAIGATYHRWPPNHKKWKAVDWVCFWQGEPLGRNIVLFEFPPGAETCAGTHSQLYFTTKVRSGEWVSMYFLTQDAVVEKIGCPLHFGAIPRDGVPLLLGSYSWSTDFSQPLTQMLKGDLDEIRFSRGARSADAIAQVSAAKSELEIDDQTLALWHFNEEAGPCAAEAGGDTTLTLRNFGGSNPTRPQADGPFGYCRRFDDSYMVTLPSPKLDTTRYDAWTLEFWCRFEDNVHSSTFFHVSPIRWLVALMGPPGAGDEGRRGKLSVHAADPGLRGAALQAATRVTDSQWHYVAVTFERGEGITIYIDGQRDAQAAAPGLPPRE